MISARSIFVLAAVALSAPSYALAQQSYPVSGKWTYENAAAEGPAAECGRRYVTFQGQQRFDTGGGVPSYRNVSVDNIGNDTWRIIDEFATGQIHARSNYTLRKVDADHIVMQVAGNTIKLRRCQ
jgi:hypothetical protein